MFFLTDPTLFSAIQVKISPCAALVMVTIDIFALEWSGSPLLSQLIVIGGSPLVTLQVIMTVNPSTVYTGVPILTLMSPFWTEGDCEISSSSMSGTLANKQKYNYSFIPIILPYQITVMFTS